MFKYNLIKFSKIFYLLALEEFNGCFEKLDIEPNVFYGLFILHLQMKIKNENLKITRLPFFLKEISTVNENTMLLSSSKPQIVSFLLTFFIFIHI